MTELLHCQKFAYWSGIGRDEKGLWVFSILKLSCTTEEEEEEEEAGCKRYWSMVCRKNDSRFASKPFLSWVRQLHTVELPFPGTFIPMELSFL